MSIQTFTKADFYSKAKTWYAPLLGTVLDDDGSYFVADFLPNPTLKMVIQDKSFSTYGSAKDIYFCTAWNPTTNIATNEISAMQGSIPFTANYLFKNNGGSIYGFTYNDAGGLGLNLIFNVGGDWYLLTAVNNVSPYHQLIKINYPYETYSLIGLAVDGDYLSLNGKYYMTPVYLTKANQVISTVPNIYCITKKPANTTHVVANDYLLVTPNSYGFTGLGTWLLVDLLS